MKKLIALVLTCCSLAIVADAFPGQRGPGRDDRGRGPDRGGRSEWVQVDEVHFRDGKTAVAIQNCKNARERDVRCSRSRDYQCGACSEIAHSDHSSYLVYQLIGGGGGGWNPPPVQRELVQTYHFRDKKTAVARQKCEQYRASLPQCMQPRQYECTPCTIESHTDHSEFSLYRLGRR